jgi:ribulose-bisphosphate carboxylase large chain
MIPAESPIVSGERFRAVYRVSAAEADARAIARDLCVEQTVEFPFDLLPEGSIRDEVVGRLESFAAAGDAWEATISFAVETTGFELTQLLNVVYGNYSLKSAARLERLELPETLLAHFTGPRFGRTGLRSYVNVAERPLLCTALKPLGLSASALAELAYQLALGGIDLIKDDHGLANQPFAPFGERVERCAEAVARANRETGFHCVYAPNVSSAGEGVIRNALFAISAGAGALLVSPGLVGFGTMAELAADDRVGLPILSHPTFQGSFLANPSAGISHYALFGQIARLAGADVSIYPSFGGRFSLSFSPAECQSIVEGAKVPMANVKPIFPAPGGGMRLDRIPELLDFYGRDVVLLVGGGLFQHGPDLRANCAAFRRLVE